MNVLIVDDQPDVVEGIREGIDWSFLEVDQVFLAYNSEAARKVVTSEAVHAILCDIEMPNGSGLELVEWIGAHYPDIKCIFLTAHADFAYAQRALKLGGFDYLVQPAPYDLIESTLQRALLQLHKEKEQQQVLVYGNYVNRHEKELLDVFLREYLSGQKENAHTLIQYLKTLSIDIKPEEKSRLVIIQIQNRKKHIKKLDREMQYFVVENVFMELLGEDASRLFFCTINSEVYAGVFYGSSIWEQGKVSEKLRNFVETAGEKLYLSAACYVSGDTRFLELPKELEHLLELTESNLTGQTGVFQAGVEYFGWGRGYVPLDFERMKSFFLQGQYHMVSDMIRAYFRDLEQKGRVGKKILTYFQQDFLQLFFDILSTQSVKAHEAFQREYDVMALRKSTESLSQMYHLTEFVITFLKELNEESSKDITPVDRAVAYIRQNIHNNISRTDIAENIYVNPDYLSRLFKKEKNISLTDYIVQEKLKMATAMLRSTNLPVSVIASNIGYTNFSYFTQVFRKSFGMSPSEYRQSAQKE